MLLFVLLSLIGGKTHQWNAQALEALRGGDPAVEYGLRVGGNPTMEDFHCPKANQEDVGKRVLAFPSPS